MADHRTLQRYMSICSKIDTVRSMGIEPDAAMRARHREAVSDLIDAGYQSYLHEDDHEAILGDVDYDDSSWDFEA